MAVAIIAYKNSFTFRELAELLPFDYIRRLYVNVCQ